MAIRLPQPPKRQLKREAKKMMLSSAEPSEARRARRSAAARKPPEPPRRQPTREAKEVVLSSAAPSGVRRSRRSAAA